MTGRVSAEPDLADLARTLCGSDGPGVADLLGAVRPSELSTEFVRVEPTRFPAFRAIELRPRQGDAFGIALPELADGATWSLPDLERLLGPLEEGPRSHGLGPQLQGFLNDPAQPAQAAVYVILAADHPASPVDQVRMRIEAR